MKVVAFNGSPKADGNTYQCLNMVAESLRKENIDVEIIHVGNKTIRGCMDCGTCIKNQNRKCVIKDEVNTWIEKMQEADGILLGSPVYFGGINGTMKSFLDRAFFVSVVNGSLFRHKVGASITSVRRAGALPTFNDLNNYFTTSEMVIASSNYWNIAFGAAPGEVNKDPEGKQIMSILGKNMATLLKQLKTGSKDLENPTVEEKIFTNFIR